MRIKSNVERIAFLRKKRAELFNLNKEILSIKREALDLESRVPLGGPFEWERLRAKIGILREKEDYLNQVDIDILLNDDFGDRKNVVE